MWASFSLIMLACTIPLATASLATTRVCLPVQANNTISVWNNGDGVPVEIHKEEGVYVPELIFGHLLTSSNYNDDEKKVGSLVTTAEWLLAWMHLVCCMQPCWMHACPFPWRHRTLAANQLSSAS